MNNFFKAWEILNRILLTLMLFFHYYYIYKERSASINEISALKLEITSLNRKFEELQNLAAQEVEKIVQMDNNQALAPDLANSLDFFACGLTDVALFVSIAIIFVYLGQPGGNTPSSGGFSNENVDLSTKFLESFLKSPYRTLRLPYESPLNIRPSADSFLVRHKVRRILEILSESQNST